MMSSNKKYRNQITFLAFVLFWNLQSKICFIKQVAPLSVITSLPVRQQQHGQQSTKTMCQFARDPCGSQRETLEPTQPCFVGHDASAYHRLGGFYNTGCFTDFLNLWPVEVTTNLCEILRFCRNDFYHKCRSVDQIALQWHNFSQHRFLFRFFSG